MSIMDSNQIRVLYCSMFDVGCGPSNVELWNSMVRVRIRITVDDWLDARDKLLPSMGRCGAGDAKF